MNITIYLAQNQVKEDGSFRVCNNIPSNGVQTVSIRLMVKGHRSPDQIMTIVWCL